MAEVPLEELVTIASSLTPQEWDSLGGRQELPPQELSRRLQQTFGRGFPETLWRRHKDRKTQLRMAPDVRHVLTDDERAQLDPLPPGSGPLAQRVLETFDAERVDDLLERMREHRARQARERAAARQSPREVIVQGYDFRHPARVNRDQMRTIESLHEHFARLLSSTLSGAMRRVIDVDTAFVDQTTYREYILSLSNPACSYEFSLGTAHGTERHAHFGRVVLDFAMPVVFGLVDRIFGGKGWSKGVDPRLMTQAEMGIMARVVRRAVEDLERTWEAVLDVDVYDIELETNPEFLQITAAPEIVLLLAFEVNAPGISGLVSLCYPFFTLEPILPRLGVQSYARPTRTPAQIRGDNRLRLGAMDVPAVVELGRTRLPASTARDLQAGDVIRLDGHADEPVRVFLGGKPKYLGYPCADGSDLQVRLAGRVPPQFAAPYGRVPATESPPDPDHRPIHVVRS